MKPNKLAVLAVGIGLALVAGCVSPTSAQAQTPELTESMTVSPSSRRLKVDAGQTVPGELTIVNDGKTAYDFIVYSRPYSIDDEKYQVANFQTAKPNADAYQWVRFSKTKYRVESGQTVKVNYQLAVPANAAPGGHYGVVFAETAPVNEASGNAVVRKKRVGSIIYATVNGKYIESGEFKPSSTAFWQLQPPLQANVAARNTGNTDFVNTVKWTVSDIFGNMKYQESKEYVVLPDTTRLINLQWPGSPWFGVFKVHTSQQFLGKTETGSSYVLMMPRFLPVVGLILLVTGVAYAIFRSKRRR